MSFCRFFILRPVATILLALALLCTGALCYPLLPVASLPDIGSSTINVEIVQPGASPEQMVRSVTTPLERYLGQIAGVKGIESNSANSIAFIRIDFVSSRNIDGALRDVQASLRAARADLPRGTLDNDPIAFKEDPTAQPVYLLSLTSDIVTLPKLFDFAQIRVRPLLARIKGVGNVAVVGSSAPAVRVDVNPYALFKWGVGFEDVRQALASANARTPKGFLNSGDQRLMLETNDQAENASQYRDLIIGYRNNFNPIRLASVAEVTDSVQDLYQAGFFNGKPAITLIVHAQPKANTVRIVDAVEQRMATLRYVLPPGVEMETTLDLSSGIRASMRDTQLTLVVSTILVIGVILFFLRRVRSTIIPAVTVPIALISTMAMMKWQNFTLDIMSLMALTIAVGFVVDDAIVVLENIARHMEAGMDRMSASIKGSEEIGFTVLSITVSLIAVFLPLLFIPGQVGAIFYEFSMTIVSALLVSLVMSLTLTPMMCALWLQIDDDNRSDTSAGEKIRRIIDMALRSLIALYGRTLHVALRHHVLTAFTLPLSFVLLVASIILMPKTGVPAQDISILSSAFRGDETMSFSDITRRNQYVDKVIRSDPDVISTISWIGSSNEGQLFARLTDKSTRLRTDIQIIESLRKKLDKMPGLSISLRSAGDPSGGGGQSRIGAFRYVLHDQDEAELKVWMPRLVSKLRNEKIMSSIMTNFEGHGASVHVRLRRDAEARFLITPELVGNVLYDAYGQALVSRIHSQLTTHGVVLEVARAYRESPELLHSIWISTASGTPTGAVRSNQIRVKMAGNTKTSTPTRLSEASLRNAIANQITGNNSNGSAVASSIETMVPLVNVADLSRELTSLQIDHKNGMTSAAINFDLIEGKTYAEAQALIEQKLHDMGAPPGLTGGLTGLAGESKETLINELIAFIAALITMYIVLGILYESLIHPLTILSTLPSAGIGAVFGLWISGESFSLVAMIAMILLTGIVKKNAILIIDFALHAEKYLGHTPSDAIYEACLTRFRPILMTTLTTALGALPLMLGHGSGSEMRRPLGVAIVGGMLISQLLTLYTTPVVYLYMDALGRFGTRLWNGLFPVLSRKASDLKPLFSKT